VPAPNERDARGSLGPRDDELYKLHPLSLIFSLGAVARSYLVPAVVVLFSSGGRSELFFAALFLPAAVYAVLHYLTFSYRFRDDELVVRGGILVRYERHVPYPRIQNIDLAQNPLHRLLKVAQVKIETASGKEPEAVMNVLGLDAVDLLRRRVYDEQVEAAAESEGAVVAPLAPGPLEGTEASKGETPGSPNPAAGKLLYQLSTGNLLLLGLLSNRGLAVVAAVWGLAFQADFDLEERIEAGYRRVANLSEDGNTFAQFENLGLFAQVALGLAAFLALFAFLKILSVVWVFVRFHGFRLERAGEDLRISFGLFTRLSATLPRKRIQVLGIHAGPIQRRLDRVSFRAQTAGSAEDNGSAQARSFLAPLIRREDCRRLLEEVQPGVLDANREPDWKPADFRAWRRVANRRFILVALLTGLLVLRFGFAAAVGAIPLVILAILSARGWMRRLAYAVESNALILRKGWLRHETGIIPHSRIQSVTLDRSPFDRRWGMATLSVDAAGSGGAQVRTRIPYLPEEEARALMARLHAEAVARPLVWG
jgi:putative membrane protein